jgi:hypothetical protein
LVVDAAVSVEVDLELGGRARRGVAAGELGD